MSDTPALVVIDVQKGLIEGFEEDWSDVLPVISGLVFRARDDGVPVVLVRHCGSTQANPLHRTQPGWAVHPAVDPQPGDLRVEKRWSDAFRDTTLDAMLREALVTRVVSGRRADGIFIAWTRPRVERRPLAMTSTLSRTATPRPKMGC